MHERTFQEPMDEQIWSDFSKKISFYFTSSTSLLKKRLKRSRGGDSSRWDENWKEERKNERELNTDIGERVH